jgi:hypothetical protein
VVAGAATLEQDIGGLDVAVHEPALMRRVESIAHLCDHLRCLGGREAPLAGDERREVGPLHESHRYVQLALLVPGIEDRDHVRVVDRSGEPRLALEALAELVVRGKLRGDQLHRALPLERDVGGPENDPHSAAPGQLVEAVAGDHITNRKRDHGRDPDMLGSAGCSAPVRRRLSHEPAARERTRCRCCVQPCRLRPG